MIVRHVSDMLPLQRVRGQMEDLFNHFWGDGGTSPFAVGGPAVNVWEDDHSLFVETELPGMNLADVDVTVMGNELTIKGERKDTTIEGATYHRRERTVGTFARTMTLPVEIDSAKVTATLKDGVLMITLPKAEAAKPRKIEVK